MTPALLLKSVGALLALLALLAMALVVIVVTLVLRVAYESVMLIPRVVQAERAGMAADTDTAQYEHAGPSWPEYLVREDTAIQPDMPWPRNRPVVPHHPV